MARTERHGQSFITPEGGIAVSLTNRGGHVSVKGEVVTADLSNNNAFYINSPSDLPIGVVYESGIAVGKEVIIVFSGRAQVLLEDALSGGRSNYVFVSSLTAGRADASVIAAPSASYPHVLGRCLQTITGGTSVLCWVMLQMYNIVDSACNPNSMIVFTGEGGRAVSLINDTGSTSVKGTIVVASSNLDLAFSISDADEEQPIGAVYEDGVANGGFCFVVVGDLGDVLLEDGTSGTRGYWVRTSETQQGRVDATNPAPPGGGIPELGRHMAEIGHSHQSVSAGKDKLMRMMIHFN